LIIASAEEPCEAAELAGRRRYSKRCDTVTKNSLQGKLIASMVIRM